MARAYPARTADTSLTTGTGPISISGVAPSISMRTFNQVLAIGDTVYLGVAHRDKNQWEEGLYTYVGTNRFARTTILQSSNQGSAVDFSAGIKDVFATIPSFLAEQADTAISETGTAVLDFGTNTTETSLVVATTTIPATAIVSAHLFLTATTDHTAADHWTARPIVAAGEVVTGTSFTIRAAARSGTLSGTYAVSWWWK